MNKNEIRVGDKVTGTRSNWLVGGLADLKLLELVEEKVEEEIIMIKVGDIVTGADCNWLTNGLAEVVSISSGGDIDIKVIKSDSRLLTAGQIDGGWREEFLKFISKGQTHPQIKVTIKGKKTIVEANGSKGVARCLPEDEVNEYEGIRIALARAYGVEPFPKTIVVPEIEIPVPVVENKTIEDFNVGDRVKVVSKEHPFCYKVAIGSEGVIEKIGNGTIVIQFDLLTREETQVITHRLNCLEVIEQPVIKVPCYKGWALGSIIDSSMAKELVEDGGRAEKIDSHFIYYKEGNKLMFIDKSDGEVGTSNGYSTNFFGNFKVVRFPADATPFIEIKDKNLANYTLEELFAEMHLRMKELTKIHR